MLNSSGIQSALPLINIQLLSRTISASPSLAYCGNLLPIRLGTDRLQRKEGHLPNHPTHSSCACKYTGFFPWRTSIKASFGSDCLNHCFALLLQAIRCAGNYCAFLGGRNQTELYSSGKKKVKYIFSCQWNSFKMPSMLLSSCLQLCFFWIGLSR